jgi:hypothetical protein
VRGVDHSESVILSWSGEGVEEMGWVHGWMDWGLLYCIGNLYTVRIEKEDEDFMVVSSGEKRRASMAGASTTRLHVDAVVWPTNYRLYSVDRAPITTSAGNRAHLTLTSSHLTRCQMPHPTDVSHPPCPPASQHGT